MHTRSWRFPAQVSHIAVIDSKSHIGRIGGGVVTHPGLNLGLGAGAGSIGRSDCKDAIAIGSIHIDPCCSSGCNSACSGLTAVDQDLVAQVTLELAAGKGGGRSREPHYRGRAIVGCCEVGDDSGGVIVGLGGRDVERRQLRLVGNGAYQGGSTGCEIHLVEVGIVVLLLRGPVELAVAGIDDAALCIAAYVDTRGTYQRGSSGCLVDFIQIGSGTYGIKLPLGIGRKHEIHRVGGSYRLARERGVVERSYFHALALAGVVAPVGQ